MRLHNLPAKKQQRRELRSHLTPEEAFLWSHLQQRKLSGRKFRRQHSIGPYILDFYCPAEKLAVELEIVEEVSHMERVFDEDLFYAANQKGLISDEELEGILVKNEDFSLQVVTENAPG